MPLVSVVMPVHNASATLGQAVRSVLAQSHSDWELLITDDGSEDDSWQLLEAFADDDRRIRPERTATSGGAARARNRAIERARGDYVAFLDSDDLWLPAKLERQLLMAGSSGAPLTYTAYFKVARDFAGEAVDWTGNDRVVRPPDRLDYRTLLRQNYIGCLTAMYDRRALGPRLMPDLPKRHDYALWLDILRDGATAQGLTEPLALYRESGGGSLSGNKLDLVRHNWHLYRHLERLSLPRSMWALGQTTVRSVLKGRI